MTKSQSRESDLRDFYRSEGWGVVAEKAGFDPLSTESSARQAFQFAWDEIVEREAELIYLRRHGKEGAVWPANASKEVWRQMARESLSTEKVTP